VKKPKKPKRLKAASLDVKTHPKPKTPPDEPQPVVPIADDGGPQIA
jgi:hypothetical protein